MPIRGAAANVRTGRPPSDQILPSTLTMSVTATGGGTVILNGILLRVLVLTHAHAVQGGATASSQTPGGAYQKAITTTVTGSRVYGALCDNTSFTANGSTTLIDNVVIGAGSVGSCRATALTGSPGSVTIGASSPAWIDGGVALLEVLSDGIGPLTEDASGPAAASSSSLTAITSASFDAPSGALLVALVSSFTATMALTDNSGLGLNWVQKVSIGTDGYSGVWIAQLPPTGGPPLGGAETFKRYSAAATNGSRWYMPLQRGYFDPTLLSPTTFPFDPTQAGRTGRDLSAYADRREVPQQRPYISDPLLLTTAQLENELLGGGDTFRHQQAAMFTDRREVPQQPVRNADPLLIQTAQNENVVGSLFDPSSAASYVDRREVPQQRAYYDPTLLAPTTPDFDNTQAGRTGRDLAAYIDRREVPQQRPYGVDPLLLTAPITVVNTFEGGVDTVTPTAGIGGNTGGGSGNFLDIVTIAGTATQTFDSAFPRRALGINFTTGAVAANTFAGWSTSLFPNPAGQTWFDADCYLTANPPNNLRIIRVLQSGTLRASVVITSAGKVGVFDANSTSQGTSTTTLPLNAHFRIEGYFIGDSSAGAVEVKLFITNPDGVVADETLTVPGINTGGAFNQLTFGNPASSASYTLRMDNIGGSTIGYIGPFPSDPTAMGWPSFLQNASRAATHADRRLVPQQRSYISDPLLLTTALLENELLGGADTARHLTWFTDRRMVPQQRLYISDPLLLATALLESPLLTRDFRQAMWFTDRRLVPQQRLYISDPSFYPSGAATDPLTLAFGAGGYYWHLYNRAADFTDRREVPQQRSYVSDPLMLLTALLENELLGGADTARHLTWFTPRWWMPQQPLRLADPLLIGTSLLESPLLGSGDNARHLAAAEFTDRREVPQQRLYISDPSFYPTTTPGDPHTVAWGDGGTYWLLYNQAGYFTDRREAPQQRLYISDPNLLGTAELENELLGGAGTQMRYLEPATHAPRWWMPQQPARAGLAAEVIDIPLLGWGDTLRRYLAAAYTDRREVPQQRPYISDPTLVVQVFLVPPLLGQADLIRRWRHAASYYDRRLVPQQPFRYFPFGAPLPPPVVVFGSSGAGILVVALADGGTAVVPVSGAGAASFGSSAGGPLTVPYSGAGQASKDGWYSGYPPVYQPYYPPSP